MRSILQCLCLGVLCVSTLVAQTATFERKVIPVDPLSLSYIRAIGDLNEDGVPDLVFRGGASDSQLAVLLSTGPGMFRTTPLLYDSPHGIYNPKVMDANADGHLDVLVSSGIDLTDETHLRVFLGNGDGTLRTPLTTTVKRGQSEFVRFADFADFNNDGKPDAVLPNNGFVSVFLAKGDGTFQTAPINSSSVGITSFFWTWAGDFDGDGKQDVLIFPRYSEEEAPEQRNVTVKFLWGEGTGRFGPVMQGPTYNEATFGAIVDLNRDGRSDIIGPATVNPNTDQQARIFFVLYGGSNREFLSESIPHPVDLGISRLPAGDVDSDGDVDLAITHRLQTHYLLYRTSSGWSAPTSYYPADNHYGQPIVADFTKDTKDDILVPMIDLNNGRASAMELFVNTSSGGQPCSIPSGNGINICSPTDNSTVTSPVRLRATAKLSAAVYRFEVWANGTKIYTGRDTNSIDAPVEMAPGTYMVTFVARTLSGERQEKTIKITVSGTQACARPGSPGIVICEPEPFAQVTSPFHVRAFANTGSSPTYRIELWAGPTKLATARDTDLLDATVSLPVGTHRLTFVARRLDGTRYTKEITVTVR
jgi:hypothetical protein